MPSAKQRMMHTTPVLISVVSYCYLPDLSSREIKSTSPVRAPAFRGSPIALEVIERLAGSMVLHREARRALRCSKRTIGRIYLQTEGQVPKKRKWNDKCLLKFLDLNSSASVMMIALRSKSQAGLVWVMNCGAFADRVDRC